MKTNNITKIVLSLIVTSALLTACSNEEISNSTSNKYGINFEGTFVQQDQMARPAINTVFIASGAPKDAFNATIPSQMGAAYQSVFQS